MRILVAFGIFLSLAPPALAGVVETPACRRDLPTASRLIEAVAARDRAGRPASTARLCAALRKNRSDMAAAAAILSRCLTGHERGENVGQLAASVMDVDTVIARRCR